METKNNGPRIIISGGGTGGHIFPAVSIANAIKELRPDAEILFVGAEGRMEMQRVPDAGYKIIGLPVAGFDRKRLWKNFAVIIKLLRSQWKARRILKEFSPQVAVGVGGYASGPTLKVGGHARVMLIGTGGHDQKIPVSGFLYFGCQLLSKLIMSKFCLFVIRMSALYGLQNKSFFIG